MVKSILFSILSASAIFALECECALEVYLNDPDPSGTNIRATPRGEIVDKIYDTPEDGGKILLVCEADKGWFRLATGGWIHGSVISTGAKERHFTGSKITLSLFKSNDSSHVVQAKEQGGKANWRPQKLLSCDDKSWVMFLSETGQQLWLSAEDQCSSPVTTCP